MSIFVTIGFTDHFVELFLRHLFAQAKHDGSEFFNRNEPVIVLVEDSVVESKKKLVKKDRHGTTFNALLLIFRQLAVTAFT
jgi:hypothetical protein